MIHWYSIHNVCGLLRNCPVLVQTSFVYERGAYTPFFCQDRPLIKHLNKGTLHVNKYLPPWEQQQQQSVAE